MAATKKNISNKRRSLLAVVHIAKADLQLDDDVYRQIVANHCKSGAGSAADCTEAELVKIIKYFERQGWKNNSKKQQQNKNRHQRTGTATERQIKFAKDLWIALSHAGVVRDNSEAAFRRWVTAQTRRYHPQRAGYADLKFAPVNVASKVIEHLKQWAARYNVESPRSLQQ